MQTTLAKTITVDDHIGETCRVRQIGWILYAPETYRPGRWWPVGHGPMGRWPKGPWPKRRWRKGRVRNGHLAVSGA